MTLSLQEILIVGSAVEQAKFSELTMDMFRLDLPYIFIKLSWVISIPNLHRMLQTLEREPQESFHGLSSTLPMGPHGGPHGRFSHQRINSRLDWLILSFFITDASPATSRMPAYVPGSKGYIENGDNRRSMRDNPHKYLLYKPSLSQLMVFLSSGFKELPPGGALLLYISADGCFSTTKHPQDCEWKFWLMIFVRYLMWNQFFIRWLWVRWNSHECETGWNREWSNHKRKDGGHSQRASLLVSWWLVSLYTSPTVHHHWLW
jgi:Protein SCAI